MEETLRGKWPGRRLGRLVRGSFEEKICKERIIEKSEAVYSDEREKET